MKFIFANNFHYLRGGSERVFFEEMELLKGHGHDVASFSRQFEKNISSQYSSFFPPSIEYENVSFIKKISSGLKLIYAHDVYRAFTKFIDFIMPDVIHAHNIYGRLTSAIIDASNNRSVPVVMTLHDYKLLCPSYLMLSNGVPCEKCRGGGFYNCLLTKCHKDNYIFSSLYAIESYFNDVCKKYGRIRYFICPSRFSLEKHAELRIAENKLVHIPNFIMIEHFEPNYSPGDYILYAGRISKEKGVMTLLESVSSLDVKVKIVGDGPIRAECEAFDKDKGKNNVVFEGYKSGEDLKRLFKNAAFVIFPSECYENAPMTILEAFAYGKPVIGSDIGGIPEMVIDGKTGLIFKAGDSHELTEKIKYLMTSPSLVISMSRNARKKVEDEYNATLHYKKLMEVYEKVL